jgi:hypothetical protein
MGKGTPAVVCSLLFLLAGPAVSEEASPGERLGSHARATERAHTCTELFDALAKEVETNYPGYHLEIRGTARELEYRSRRTALRQVAAGHDGLECVALLQTYVAWFQDGHLFVSASPRPATAADSAATRAAAPRVSWNEAEVLGYLDDEHVELDPVEGLWVDPAGLRIAVLRESWNGARVAGGQRKFLAVVLASSVRTWAPGDVKAELKRLPDGSYDVVAYNDARVPVRPHVYVRGAAGGGRLQRDGLLFHFAPTTWGKLHPIARGHEGRIDPREPRAPTARIVDDATVVFHIPSHVPEHGARLHLLVDQYRGALARADNLIIDLRGNEGGSTSVTNALLPFLAGRDTLPRRYLAEGSPAVIAAEANAAAFERMGWAPRGLAARLRAASAGTLVPFADPPDSAGTTADAGRPSTAPPELSHPRNVAILVDSMTVSAAEAFVLRALQSPKVTLFGQPTGASIDYQTVNMVRVGPAEAGLLLGYPILVGSDRLPTGAVRPTGIVPDVHIDPADPDPVQRIIEYYRSR